MRYCFLTIILSFFVLFSSAAYALITETQPLSFGTFAMQDNASTHTIIVNPAGTFSAAPAYLFFSDPQESTYDVSGFPPSTPLIIMVTVNDLTTGGGGEDFTISTPNVLPAAPVTDLAGEASFAVGVRLDSSGTGTPYLNAPYSGAMTISVNF